ncbi:hypothetical protein [Archaeoglobus profundus]|uniref:Uncharacterized protein n=1 Tax=Archaeoglobus profundus (strain DSM 5631 / JCM 9629 / NBRC 100127 / Av18) TaxID=572546 RepID=D2RHG5_ARCPA|nr:hypothetical protein [Archaeoglobus profundus]ADB57740.1 hypothetical protein Arcpr_0676 [Archaeoglobus profundus DSM 5631]
MSRAIVAIAFIVALIAVYPYILNIATVSSLKGSYVVKWSEIPAFVRGTIYEESLKLATMINEIIKLLLEIAGIFVVLLTIIEYYKYHKIHKEEVSK